MNRLPKYWIVKNDFSQKFKDSVLKYLCQEHNTKLEGLGHYYGNGDGNWRCYSLIESFRNNPTLLTLDEFIELSKPIDDFVLPEKWCVKCTKENYLILDKWFFNKTGKHRIDPSHISYWHYPENNNGNSTSSKVLYDYKEITFGQFQKYVLKLKDMEKKIVGYKLIKPEYNNVAKQISNTPDWENDFERYGYHAWSEYCVAALKKAGVLDLWFEPVFEKEYPNITINGYKGEFFNDYVKFGCAQIHKNVFIDLNTLNSDLENGDGIIGMKSNRRIESITIGKGTFTKEHIRRITEYYLNKK